MTPKKLLLHTCCAPCFASVHEDLKGTYEVVSYFFNPNIFPGEEYDRRLAELSKYSAAALFPLVIERPDFRDWVREIKPLRLSGERSRRCVRCFRYRLERAFHSARESGIELVGTVLTVSPHKDAAAINGVGRDLEREYGVEFLVSDFKKGGGFGRSVELSRALGFYRQEYCGCMYSRVERRKGSCRARSLAPSVEKPV